MDRVVEVFADVCCPFAHVGLRRLRSAADARHTALRVIARAWPLELVNGHPCDACLVAREVDDLRAQVAPDLFGGFDPRAFPRTSLPAFGLAAAAYARDLATGEAVSLSLRDALFEQGRAIDDPLVLGEIAGASGLVLPDAATAARATRHDWAEGRRRGVSGSPHFFLGEQSAFCPALRIAHRDDGHLDISLDDRRLRDFLADALG